VDRRATKGAGMPGKSSREPALLRGRPRGTPSLFYDDGRLATDTLGLHPQMG
jgi:hypothetical protein